MSMKLEDQLFNSGGRSDYIRECFYNCGGTIKESSGRVVLSYHTDSTYYHSYEYKYICLDDIILRMGELKYELELLQELTLTSKVIMIFKSRVIGTPLHDALYGED